MSPPGRLGAAHSRGAATGDLAEISIPTLVGVGKLDVADFQDIARRYATEIPGATLIEFATAADLMDAPAELSAIRGAFLAR